MKIELNLTPKEGKLLVAFFKKELANKKEVLKNRKRN